MTISIRSVYPDSAFLPMLDSIEPPWYVTRMPGGVTGTAREGLPMSIGPNRDRTCGTPIGDSMLLQRRRSWHAQSQEVDMKCIACGSMNCACDKGGKCTCGKDCTCAKKGKKTK